MINRNSDALDEYIGDMFGSSVPSTPMAGALFPQDMAPVGQGQALQCTWVRPGDKGDALIAALMLWQLFRHLPKGRLRSHLHHQGKAMLAGNH